MPLTLAEALAEVSRQIDAIRDEQMRQLETSILVGVDDPDLDEVDAVLDAARAGYEVARARAYAAVLREYEGHK